jgi:hypothetical protein
MIVSASYRTDIPAFYAPWLVNRLAAGFCRVPNPYGGPDYQVSLSAGEVDGIVLWTRNIAPLAPHLGMVRERAPFVVQYTLTGYPRALEASVIDAGRAVRQIADLAARWGVRAVIWRYDPILLTSLTPSAWHERNFAALAAALEGRTDEVVVSFASLYRKTRRNLASAAQRHGFTWDDPAPEEKRALLGRLGAIAADQGMVLTVCSQPDLAPSPAGEARCIDAKRLSDVAQAPIVAPEKGNRPGCRCALSRDIGAYDSCPHGCVYCYAVASRDAALRRHRAHDPASPSLYAPALR